VVSRIENPRVGGSIPSPATIQIQNPAKVTSRGFCLWGGTACEVESFWLAPVALRLLGLPWLGPPREWVLVKSEGQQVLQLQNCETVTVTVLVTSDA